MISFVSGERVTTNDNTGRKSTVPLSDDPAHWQRSPAAHCLANLAGEPATQRGEAVEAEEAIAGFRTVRIGSKGLTSWFALDHGCALVASRMDFGAEGMSEKELVALLPGDPEHNLFAVPSSYEEGPPSTLAPTPPVCDPGCYENLRKHFEHRDAEYFKKRGR
jgi:hypothetical protein